jgi:hypothetical protein
VKEYAIISDPGKRRDRASTMIMKQTPILDPGSELVGKPDRILFFLDIIYLEQFARKPYPEQRDYLADLQGQPEFVHNSDLIIDADGVGEALIDMLCEKGLTPIPILAVTGIGVTQQFQKMGQIFSKPGSGKLMNMRPELHVGKATLVGAGRRVLEQRRLRMPRNIKWQEDFDRQLVHFTGPKDKRTQRISYNADDPNTHDDFVSDFLLGAWWFTRDLKDITIPDREIRRTRTTGTNTWDPMDY